MRFKLIICILICFAGMMSCKGGPDWIPVYVSTNTETGGPGIYSLLFNTRTGKIKELKVEAEGLKEPSFICFSPDKTALYAYNSVGSGPAEVVAYRVNPGDRSLSPFSRATTPTRSFCYIAVFNEGEYLALASYGEGTCYCFPLSPDGAILDNPSIVQHEGKGIHPRQEAPHAHTIRQDPLTGTVYVCDLGIDKIMIYSLNEGKLDSIGETIAEAGAGPRHLAFHPGGAYMATVNELNNTVWVYERDSLGFFTVPVDCGSTLPDNYSGETKASDICFSPDGKVLYAGNRGYDSIAVFSFDPETGKLERKSWVTDGIDFPRQFSLDPTGRWLLVANEEGNDVTVYAIGEDPAELSFTGVRIPIPEPMCVLF